jgi:hypothetical protein
MIDEAAIKREARLSAIEFMIGELCSAFYRDLPATAIHARHDQLCAAIALRGATGGRSGSIGFVFYRGGSRTPRANQSD